MGETGLQRGVNHTPAEEAAALFPLVKARVASLKFSRLKTGDRIVAASSITLLVSMFALTWYKVNAVGGLVGTFSGLLQGGSAPESSFNAWSALTDLRWLLLATVVSGLSIVYLQASGDVSSRPRALSKVLVVLGSLAVLSLLYRVLISAPLLGPLQHLALGGAAGVLEADALVAQATGAYIGLLSAIVLTAGGFISIRERRAVRNR
jgi:hypothetical protein